MSQNRSNHQLRMHMSPTNKSMKSNFSYQSYENSLDAATINALIGGTPYYTTTAINNNKNNNNNINNNANIQTINPYYHPQLISSSRSTLFKSLPVTPAFANSTPSQFVVSNDLLYQQQQQQQQQQRPQIQLQGTNRIYSIQNKNTTAGLYPFASGIERAILDSTDPIDIESTSEEINVNGERGFLANKSEIAAWHATNVPLSEYTINHDLNPELVTKRPSRSIEYVQEFAIRYLRPPTPPTPGEIIIQQLADVPTAPAPPLIIRQQPPRPATPEPLVIREAPPPAPIPVGRKVITISGKRIPPPPRKVIIERLAPIPPKPQSVIIERWLPYNQVKRRVIFNRADQSQEPIVVKPRNVIVQWTAPQVQIKREFKYLGVIRANPNEYVNRYRNLLKSSSDLPEFVKEIPTPHGVKLACDKPTPSVYELEGDVDALRLVDLDRAGLSEYKPLVNKIATSASYSVAPDSLYFSQISSLAQSATQGSIPHAVASKGGYTGGFTSSLFSGIQPQPNSYFSNDSLSNFNNFLLNNSPKIK